MGVPHRIRYFAQEIQPLTGIELVSIRQEIVIQPNGIRIEAVKEQRRPVFVFLVIEHGENVRVVQRLNDLELAGGGAFESLAIIFG
jgi:hypothetical protein